MMLEIVCFHAAESKYHVSTKCIPIDFSGGIEIYDKIADELTGLDVGVLGECTVHCASSLVN